MIAKLRRVIWSQPVAVLGYGLRLILMTSTAEAQQRDFERVSIEQGLSVSFVNSIFQDRRGFMWFGTPSGLNRFDGYSFTVYRHDQGDSNSISHDRILSIHEDRSGALWIIAGMSELNKFDPVTEHFSSPIPQAAVTDVFEDGSGTLWFATRGQGLLRLDPGNRTFTRYRHSRLDPENIRSDTVLSFHEDRTGRRWFGTSAGLNSLDTSSGTFSHDDHGPEGKVYAIDEDAALHGDCLWIGTDHGLYRYDRALRSFKHYENHQWHHGKGNPNDIRAVFLDREGLLWLGTQAGLAQFDRSTESFTNYRCQDPDSIETWPVGLIREDRQGTIWSIGPHNLIGEFDRIKKAVSYLRDPAYPAVAVNGHAMFEDRTGTIWFGTTTAGAIKIDPARKAFRNFTSVPFDERSLSWKAVGGILEDRSGVLWVATPVGLNRFNPAKNGMRESFTHYTYDPANPQGLSHPTIWPIVEDREGSLWLGTLGGGLDLFDRAKKTFAHHRHDPRNPRSLADDAVMSLFEDRSGTLWVGLGDEGLDEYHHASGTFVHHKPDPNDSTSLSAGTVLAIIEDHRGTLWVGTMGGGLNRYDRREKTFARYAHDPGNPGSLSNASVGSMLEDRSGNLWIGTRAGLDRFDAATGSFTRLTIKDGLASDFISGILEDDRGCLWLNAGRGISKFDPQTRAVRNYDESDGVRKSQGHAPSGFKNSRGEMFFGGIDGFVRFHPDSIRDNPYVPPVVMTAFRKFEKLVPLDSAISMKKEVSLPYSDNMFSFEFAALNYTSPGKNQYAYKLEGFDREWISSGTRRYATYTNLDPGEYTFRVRGSNNDGVWNEVGTSIAVVITPPLWKRWWFTTLAWLMVAASGAGTVRYIEIRSIRRQMRILEQQQALEHERLRIAQDMHDEVGATLTQISILSELAKKQALEFSERGGPVDRISEKSREVIENIGEIIWAINPKNDRLENLVAYMRRYALEYFRSSPILCRFHAPDTLSATPLSAETRRNIFLACKESMHNVLKHSQATEVTVTLQQLPGMLEMMVQDNGKGFSPSDPSQQGNGLKNMQRRMEEIGGSFTILSEPDHGTCVTLRTPLGNGPSAGKRA